VGVRLLADRAGDRKAQRSTKGVGGMTTAAIAWLEYHLPNATQLNALRAEVDRQSV
jgi:hypothetical protein